MPLLEMQIEALMSETTWSNMLQQKTHARKTDERLAC